MLIKDKQTHTQTYAQTHTYAQINRQKSDFKIQETSKRENESNSPLRKLDPKSIL